MRTLLTGASGYIGAHLVRELLEDGQRVTAVVRSAEKLGPLANDARLDVVVADLEDHSRFLELLRGHDTCVHAALIWGEPGSELAMGDVATTARLFDAAGRAGLSRCISLSSAAVHRPFAPEMTEEDRLSTADVYGATKAAGELFLRAACAQHQMTGVVIRPGPVVGPPAFAAGRLHTPDALSRMVRAATEGKAITVTRGEGRQFSDVSTVASAVRLLTREASPHSTYLCVDRERITWERVAEMVVACLESPSRVEVLVRDSVGPIPHFRTERIEGLLGGPTNAEGALMEHIRQLGASRQ